MSFDFEEDLQDANLGIPGAGEEDYELDQQGFNDQMQSYEEDMAAPMHEDAQDMQNDGALGNMDAFQADDPQPQPQMHVSEQQPQQAEPQQASEPLQQHEQQHQQQSEPQLPEHRQQQQEQQQQQQHDEGDEDVHMDGPAPSDMQGQQGQDSQHQIQAQQQEIMDAASLQEARESQGRVYVANLAWWATDAEVEALCSEYGQVLSLDFVVDRSNGKSKGCVLVEFATPEAAVRCSAGLTGHMLHGRPVVVSFQTRGPGKLDGPYIASADGVSRSSDSIGGGMGTSWRGGNRFTGRGGGGGGRFGDRDRWGGDAGGGAGNRGAFGAGRGGFGAGRGRGMFMDGGRGGRGAGFMGDGGMMHEGGGMGGMGPAGMMPMGSMGMGMGGMGIMVPGMGMVPGMLPMMGPAGAGMMGGGM